MLVRRFFTLPTFSCPHLINVNNQFVYQVPNHVTMIVRKFPSPFLCHLNNISVHMFLVFWTASKHRRWFAFSLTMPFVFLFSSYDFFSSISVFFFSLTYGIKLFWSRFAFEHNYQIKIRRSPLSFLLLHDVFRIQRWVRNQAVEQQLPPRRNQRREHLNHKRIIQIKKRNTSKTRETQFLFRRNVYF